MWLPCTHVYNLPSLSHENAKTCLAPTDQMRTCDLVDTGRTKCIPDVLTLIICRSHALDSSPDPPCQLILLSIHVLPGHNAVLARVPSARWCSNFDSCDRRSVRYPLCDHRSFSSFAWLSSASSRVAPKNCFPSRLTPRNPPSATEV